MYSFRVVTKNDEIKWAEVHVGYVVWEGRPAMLGILDDVTERMIAERRIQDSLNEKEVLLKEIHHRVKNNFQIIVSLLGLQLGKSTSTETVSNLRDAQNRIRAMSLIHEKLYQSKNLAMIDFGEYLKTMATELHRGICEDHGRITMEVDPDRIELSIDRAIPLGLAVSELITNAIKYAFPGDRGGAVRVAMTGGEQGQVTVTVSDDGVGLPAHFNPEKSETLGYKLVYLLVRDQMQGTIAIDRSGGTSVSLKFIDRENRSQN
jgi:two-component sensor histidine kinase